MVYRDFIPARRIADGELGLFDIEQHVFLSNDGTGTFTAGPDTSGHITGSDADTYQELEYLQSSGTQYIETMWYPSEWNVTVSKFELVNALGTSYNAIYGSVDNGKYYEALIRPAEATYNVLFGFDTRTDGFGTITNWNTPHTLKQDGPKNYIDGTLVHQYSGTRAFQAEQHLTIFAQNRNGTIQNYSAIKLYRLTISRADTPTPGTLNLYYNGNSVSDLYYNGQHVDHLVYNGSPVE